MRGHALLLLALSSLLIFGGARTTRADEPLASGRVQSAREQALVEMLAIVKLRLEARIHEGELLAQAGRLEEALEAYRSVAELSSKGLADVERRLARMTAKRSTWAEALARPTQPNRVRRRRPSPPPVAPPVEQPETAEAARLGYGEIGGALAAFRFRGRGSDRSPANHWKRDAIDEALRWLHAHQSPNGGWEAAGFQRWCDGKPRTTLSGLPDGTGKTVYDPGVTGLALTAFLTAGYTHRGKHPFAQSMAKGLRYLRAIQDPEGCFGPRSTQQYIYNHMTCALAMVEAYGMTGSPLLKASAQRALDFIWTARNPYFAWRYGIKPGDNDTSVTTWAMLVIKSALMVNGAAIKAGRAAPLRVAGGAVEGVRAWLAKVTDPDYGRVGYVQRGTGPARPQELVDRFPGERSESMTASGILMRVLAGEDPQRSKPIQLGTRLCLKVPPVWNPSDGSIDMIYWFTGTLALYQVGGEAWTAWNASLKAALGDTQRRDGDHCGYRGSWDPIGPWGLDGGRVYSTALMALTVASEARYPRVFARAAKVRPKPK